MSIGGGNLRGAPCPRVDGFEFQGAGRVVYRFGGNRVRILGRIGERIALTRSRWRSRNNLGAAAVVAGVESDMKINPEWAGNILAAIRANGLAGDAAYYLSDQITECQSMVTVFRAGFPPWFLLGERGGHYVPAHQRVR